MGNPILILITGAPGTGKTTLGKNLSEKFCLPLINKDGIKESLFDSLGIGDSSWSHKLSVASYALLFYVAESLIRAGDSLIVEGNFRPDYDSEAFHKLQKKYALKSLQIYCDTKVDILAERYRERSESGTRHPGHLDTLVAQNFERDMSRGRYKPLKIEGDPIYLDTTDFSKIDYDGLYLRIQGLINSSLKK